MISQSHMCMLKKLHQRTWAVVAKLKTSLNRTSLFKLWKFSAVLASVRFYFCINQLMFRLSYTCINYLNYLELNLLLTVENKIFYFILHLFIHAFKQFIFPIMHFTICYTVHCIFRRCTPWVQEMTETYQQTCTNLNTFNKHI